jgi:2-polyprenyl-3-methyl-5-hydroxy-6-metoxy-1,4-benzoquinol methylase
MKRFDKHSHWEKIYKAKQINEVSWFQPVPSTSLDFISFFNIPLDANIIDIGGGDSLLADHLLDLGYTNITVLDISETAIQKAKQRLGDRAKQVKWIISDVTVFRTDEIYDFWHDRATFHFLTTESEINDYINVVQQHISLSGIVVIGTFSEQGPEKCSGISIKQYSETTMTELLQEFFQKVKCVTVDHTTPFNTVQNFVFCSFRKKMAS